MQLTEAERRVLDEVVRALRRDFGASEILLYGSAARGELEPGSDIDLLVVLPQLDWEIEKEVVDLCFRAELNCDRIISTVCFSQAELTDGPLRASPMILNARKEGVPL